MNPSNKLGLATGLLVDGIKRSTSLATQNVTNYVRTKRDNFLSRPVVSAVDSSLRYFVSAENIDNMKIRYDQTYHWLVGTEIAEVQERSRYLESKLNMNRKEMRETREQLDNITERLRGIAVELESTGRGDLKHLHLRQQEYDTIQEELKLSKFVQRSEFQERETFTLLMNAVRESHETERNYNSRIKMITLIGAIIGPFLGYTFSARLNAMRFKRMEEIINKKLELLSFSTVNAIREIHGLETEVMSEPEKQGFIARILKIYYFIQYLLISAYQIAVTKSTELLETIKEWAESEGEAQAVEKASTTSTAETAVKRPTKDASTQATATIHALVEKIIVEKHIPRQVDYAKLPEFKSLMNALKTIEDKQDNMKQLLITSQELQDANKIEVSVNSSDEEIIAMLHADQQMVRKILLSVEDLLRDSRTSFSKALESLVLNIDGLSLKITNNSELYVGNLEHSKIVNDIAQSLVDIRTNIDTIETYYMNDVNKQFSELTNIHQDLSEQIGGVRKDLGLQQENLGKISDALTTGNGKQDTSVAQIESMLDGIGSVLQEIKSDISVDSMIEKVEHVTTALSDMRNLLVSTASNSNQKLDTVEKIVMDNIDKTLQHFEERILSHHQDHHTLVLEKISEISIPPPAVIYNTRDIATGTNLELETQEVPSETEGFPIEILTEDIPSPIQFPVVTWEVSAVSDDSKDEPVEEVPDALVEDPKGTSVVTSEDVDTSEEPAGYPGAVEETRSTGEETKSTVYLYTVFVVVYTVIMSIWK